ncbi:MAG: hypothetical protein ACKO7N_00090 [Candidatus Nitrosotenuis sp.]
MTTQDTRHIFSIIMAGVGIIFFWRGIWEISAKYISEESALIIGLAMLIAAAIAERKGLLRYLHSH